MKVIKNCPNCNIDFISENRERRKFCSQSCSAIFNNKKRKGKEKICLGCNNSFYPIHKKQKCCSRSCAGKYKSLDNYNKVMSGEENLSLSYSPRSAKKFIIIEQDNKCSVCSMKNEWNGKEIIFILDHIDGDGLNHKRENLRLVCPNCDSQLDTYKSKNKNGRFYRRERYKEGKSY